MLLTHIKPHLKKSSMAFARYMGIVSNFGPGSSLRNYSQSNGAEGASSETKTLKRCEYCKDYDILNDNFEALKQENDLLIDKYKRALAEVENTRRRAERQIEEAKSFAIQGFCKDLLEVADVLNIAVETLEKEVAKDSSLKSVYQGINMTKNSLLKAFSKHGLVQVDPEGMKFDPNLHEAIFEVPQGQSKHPPGHISHVLNIGYSLHNRPVRPAKVGVVKTN